MFCGIFDRKDGSTSDIIFRMLDRGARWQTSTVARTENIGDFQVAVQSAGTIRRTNFVTHKHLTIAGTIKPYFAEDALKSRSNCSSLKKIANLYLNEGISGIKSNSPEGTFTLYDSHKKALVLSRTPQAKTSIFYSSNNSNFAFSSSLESLFTVPFVQAEPDIIALQNYLACNWELLGQTGYQEIRRLEKGTVVEFQLGNYRKWDMEPEPRTPLSSSENSKYYYEQFRHVLKQCIEDSVEGESKVATQFSGGLDSSSVAGMYCSKSTPLRGYYAEAQPTKFTSDSPGIYTSVRPLAKKMGQRWANFEPFETTTQGRGFFYNIDNAFFSTPFPFYGPFNRIWWENISEMAADHGYSCLLNGMGGNLTFSSSGPARAGLRDHYLRAVAIKNNLAGLISSKSLLWHKNSYLNLPFQTKLHLSRRARFWYSGKWNAKRYLKDSPNDNTYWLYGITPKAVPLEAKLINFCASLPPWVFKGANKDRLLVREGLASLLPSEISQNKKRGRQAADWPFHFQNAKKGFVIALSEFRKNPIISSLLDLPRMEQDLKLFSYPPTIITPEFRMKFGQAFPRSILTGLFILRAEKVKHQKVIFQESDFV